MEANELRRRSGIAETDYARQAEYGAKIGILMMNAKALKNDVAALNLAPSIAAKLDEALKTVVSYLSDLYRHTQR